MTNKAKRKLFRLRSDFESVTGKPFANFFCPMLYVDDDVRLCAGHIVNQAFRNSPRRSTIQRADVDDFFGSMFEADWLAIQERGRNTLREILSDKDMSRLLDPRIIRDGTDVPFYAAPDSPIPPGYTAVAIQESKGPERIILKLDSDLVGQDAKWELQVSKDLRLPAVVSLLKVAHLSLFELLGYRYVFSSGGHLLGHDALGRFFLANRGLAKRTILKNARMHFAQYATVVRPVLEAEPSLKGTLADGLVNFCMMDARSVWGLIVFIRIGSQVHAVLAPTFSNSDCAARYLRFLAAPPPRFEVRPGKFENGQWSIAKTGKIVEWPPTDLS